MGKDGNGNERRIAVGIHRAALRDSNGGGGARGARGGGGGAVCDDAGNTGSHIDLVTGVSVRVFQWVRGMNFGCKRKDAMEEKR